MARTRVQVPTTDVLTVEKALAAAATPSWRKPVIRQPLTQAFPALSEIKEFRSKICLFDADRTKVFDVVSPRYQLVEHAQAVDAVEAALAKYFGAKASDLRFNIRTLRNGAAIRGEVKLPIAPIRLGKDDVNELTLNLGNSYDRSSPFRCELGAFRLICSNGMKVGQFFGSISARHVGGERAELGDGNDSILDQLDNIVKRAPLVKEVWQKWQDTPLELEEAQELMGNWELPRMYADPIFETSRWTKPRTKWQFYNDLTHMSTHLTRSMQRRLDFDDWIAKVFYEDAVEV